MAWPLSWAAWPGQSKGSSPPLGRPGNQPPPAVEVALEPFGIGLLSIAHSAMPHGRRRTAAMGFAAASIAADVVAVVTEVVGEVAGAAIAASSLALVVGLVTLDRHQPSPTPLAWWIGVAMLPAVFVGGIASEIDERLLEVPLSAWGSRGCSLAGSSCAARPLPRYSRLSVTLIAHAKELSVKRPNWPRWRVWQRSSAD